MRVTIVLDPSFGEHGDIPAEGAFWMVDSPANRSLAERLWAKGGYDPNSAVFKATSGADPAETLAGLWRTIQTHHPDMTEVVIPGFRPTAGFAEVVAPFEVTFQDGCALARR